MVRIVARLLLVAVTVAAAGIAVPAGADGSVGAADPPAAGTVGEPVSFTSDGEQLHGTVFSRAGAAPGRPAVVLVAGTGASLSPERSRDLVEPLTRAGIDTLVYEKRTEGYSATQRSYPQLADDALAGVALMRGRPGVDPARVGLWGISEGGWVAPIAASRSPGVGFVVLTSASGFPPARQTAWALGNVLRHEGVSDPVADHLATDGVRLVAGLGQFPEADHDTVAALRTTRQPVLGLWGALDRTVPPAESMTVVRDALEQGGNRRYSLRVLPGVGHTMHRTPDGFANQDQFTSEFLDPVAAWIRDLPATPPAGSDAPPAQERTSRSLAPAGWTDVPAVQAGALAAMVLVFGGYLVTGAGRRLRARGRTPSVAPGARLLALAGLLVPIGFCVYLADLLLTQDPGPVVLGVPVVVALLRVGAGIAALAAVWTALGWWRRRHVAGVVARTRLGALLAAAALLVAWAGSWGLLV